MLIVGVQYASHIYIYILYNASMGFTQGRAHVLHISGPRSRFLAKSMMKLKSNLNLNEYY